jgi:nicotinamidase-related amidase
VFYTESARRADLLDSGVQVGKSHRGSEKTVLEGTHATQTVAPLAPREQDLRIAKRKPSCFFGTIFMSHLNFLDIDTLISPAARRRVACAPPRSTRIRSISRS